VEPGFLFMCSNATFGECVSRSLLGESKEKLGLVQAVVKPSTPLLLLNFSRRVVYGPFWAAAAPALYIEPCAWEGGATNSRRRGRPESSGTGDATSPYPVQVRMQRRGRVRSWSLPEGMHLKAGRLTAAQTAELMQALKEGSVAAEADRVIEDKAGGVGGNAPRAAASSTTTPSARGTMIPRGAASASKASAKTAAAGTMFALLDDSDEEGSRSEEGRCPPLNKPNASLRKQEGSSFSARTPPAGACRSCLCIL
jgi:hypothetical protein